MHATCKRSDYEATIMQTRCWLFIRVAGDAGHTHKPRHLVAEVMNVVQVESQTSSPSLARVEGYAFIGRSLINSRTKMRERCLEDQTMTRLGAKPE